MKLTKTMRTEVLTKVLKEVFEPKFNDLQKRLVKFGRQWLQENHPVFVELLARKDTREYLHTKNWYRLRLNSEYHKPLYYPEYGTDDFDEPIKLNELRIPYIINDSFILSESQCPLGQVYTKLWDDYRSAFNELHSVLYSYSSREKLLADFPEYSKYLPVPTVVALPAVIPSEARAKLSALGIPADASVL